MDQVMRFSLRFNNDLSLVEYIELVQIAEDEGFDQFWVSNDLFLRSAQVIVAALGVATSRIEIGTCILNPYTVNPSEIAMFASTMDELTDCRFNLGVAAGSADFLDWIGLGHSKPLTAMRETITAIRGLQSGENVSLMGDFLNWSDKCHLRFQAPRLTPIYLGAMGPKMLELAGELADGLLPLLHPPEHYYGVRDYVDKGIRKRPENASAFDFVGSIWVSLDENRKVAHRLLAEKIAYFGPGLGELNLKRLGLTKQDFAAIESMLFDKKDLDNASKMVDNRMMKIGIVGQPQEIIERLCPLIEAGMQHLSFGPPLGANRIQTIKLLGKHVLPFFRQKSEPEKANQVKA